MQSTQHFQTDWSQSSQGHLPSCPNLRPALATFPRLRSKTSCFILPKVHAMTHSRSLTLQGCTVAHIQYSRCRVMCQHSKTANPCHIQREVRSDTTSESLLKRLHSSSRTLTGTIACTFLISSTPNSDMPIAFAFPDSTIACRPLESQCRCIWGKPRSRVRLIPECEGQSEQQLMLISELFRACRCWVSLSCTGQVEVGGAEVCKMVEAC